MNRDLNNQAPTIVLAPAVKLRAFAESDVKRLVKLANEASVQQFTLGLPDPYVESSAREWICGGVERFQDGVEVVFAIAKRGHLIGSVGLTLEREHQRAEIGYWLGTNYRGQGIGHLAVAAATDFAHRELRLKRVYALCFSNNLPSQRLLLGLRYKREGCLRSHLVKTGKSQDAVCFGHVL